MGEELESTQSRRSLRCTIVNNFDIEHKHEGEMLVETYHILDQLGVTGAIFANIYCGPVELDSLLVTPFGVYIIEYKSYPEVDKVRINAQYDFECLKADGTPIIDRKTNLPLMVHGGAHSNPFAQALTNNSQTRKKFVEIFGEQAVKAMNLQLIIIMRGTHTQIQGINHIAEKKWLSVKNYAEFEAYMRDEKRKAGGLTEAQCQRLMTNLDVTRGIGVAPVPILQQIDNCIKIRELGKAHVLLKQCDITNPEVIVKLMMVLYLLRNSTDELKNLIEKYINSSHETVRDVANYVCGMSYYHGYNGFKKDVTKALAYLRESSLAVTGGEVEMVENELREARKKEKNEFVRMKAHEAHRQGGRHVATALRAVGAMTILACLLASPGSGWMKLAIASAVPVFIAIAYLATNYSTLAWLVMDSPLPYAKEIGFFSDAYKANPKYKVGKRELYAIFSIVYYILALFLCYKVAVIIMEYFMTKEFISHGIAWIDVHTGVFIPLWMSRVILAYAFINAVYLIYTIVCPASEKHNENEVIVALPNVMADISDKFVSAFKLMIGGWQFGVILTAALCVAGALAPYAQLVISKIFTM